MCLGSSRDEDLTEHIVATEIDNPNTWLCFYAGAKEFQKLLGRRRKALNEDIF
jgi:hypothetical protein